MSILLSIDAIKSILFLIKPRKNEEGHIFYGKLLSLLRILLSPLLLAFKPLSIPFFIFYLFLGISDIVFLFFSALIILPLINIPRSLFVLIGIVFLLRVMNIIVSLYRYKRVILLHTWLNKTVGFLLFLFPLSLHFIKERISVFILSLIALIATIDESYKILNKA